MAGWTVHKGLAVVLPHDNIDTDQLIPARFMSAPRAEGYGDFLLHDLRRDEAGKPDPAFPLNRHPAASVMVSGRNFGSGSSREAAVYALVDAGFRVVVAPSFGDIFTGNAINNGLLPARVTPRDHAALVATLADTAAEVTVDLAECSIAVADLRFSFDLEDGFRMKLIKGWDDIDLTLQHAAEIGRFKKTRIQTAAWAWPKAGSQAPG